jgi:hypothetical protein
LLSEVFADSVAASSAVPPTEPHRVYRGSKLPRMKLTPTTQIADLAQSSSARALLSLREAADRHRGGGGLGNLASERALARVRLVEETGVRLAQLGSPYQAPSSSERGAKLSDSPQ